MRKIGHTVSKMGCYKLCDYRRVRKNVATVSKMGVVEKAEKLNEIGGYSIYGYSGYIKLRQTGGYGKLREMGGYS